MASCGNDSESFDELCDQVLRLCEACDDCVDTKLLCDSEENLSRQYDKELPTKCNNRSVRELEIASSSVLKDVPNKRLKPECLQLSTQDNDIKSQVVDSKLAAKRPMAIARKTCMVETTSTDTNCNAKTSPCRQLSQKRNHTTPKNVVTVMTGQRTDVSTKSPCITSSQSKRDQVNETVKVLQAKRKKEISTQSTTERPNSKLTQVNQIKSSQVTLVDSSAHEVASSNKTYVQDSEDKMPAQPEARAVEGKKSNITSEQDAGKAAVLQTRGKKVTGNNTPISPREDYLPKRRKSFYTMKVVRPGMQIQLGKNMAAPRTNQTENDVTVIPKNVIGSEKDNIKSKTELASSSNRRRICVTHKINSSIEILEPKKLKFADDDETNNVAEFEKKIQTENLPVAMDTSVGIAKNIEPVSKSKQVISIVESCECPPTNILKRTDSLSNTKSINRSLVNVALPELAVVTSGATNKISVNEPITYSRNTHDIVLAPDKTSDMNNETGKRIKSNTLEVHSKQMSNISRAKKETSTFSQNALEISAVTPSTTNVTKRRSADIREVKRITTDKSDSLLEKTSEIAKPVFTSEIARTGILRSHMKTSGNKDKKISDNDVIILEKTAPELKPGRVKTATQTHTLPTQKKIDSLYPNNKIEYKTNIVTVVQNPESHDCSKKENNEIQTGISHLHQKNLPKCVMSPEATNPEHEVTITDVVLSNDLKETREDRKQIDVLPRIVCTFSLADNSKFAEDIRSNEINLNPTCNKHSSEEKTRNSQPEYINMSSPVNSVSKMVTINPKTSSPRPSSSFQYTKIGRKRHAEPDADESLLSPKKKRKIERPSSPGGRNEGKTITKSLVNEEEVRIIETIRQSPQVVSVTKPTGLMCKGQFDQTLTDIPVLDVFDDEIQQERNDFTNDSKFRPSVSMQLPNAIRKRAHTGRMRDTESVMTPETNKTFKNETRKVGADRFDRSIATIETSSLSSPPDETPIIVFHGENSTQNIIKSHKTYSKSTKFGSIIKRRIAETQGNQSYLLPRKQKLDSVRSPTNLIPRSIAKAVLRNSRIDNEATRDSLASGSTPETSKSCPLIPDCQRKPIAFEVGGRTQPPTQSSGETKVVRVPSEESAPSVSRTEPSPVLPEGPRRLRRISASPLSSSSSAPAHESNPACGAFAAASGSGSVLPVRRLRRREPRPSQPAVAVRQAP